MISRAITSAVILTFVGVSLLIPASAHEIGVPIRLVLVEPAGEHLTPQEKFRSFTNAVDAVQWWNDALPGFPTIYISETVTISATADIYDMANDPSYEDSRNLFVIDNSSSGNLLLVYLQSITTTPHQSWTVIDHPNLNVAMARELGRLVYDIPYWYYEEGDLCAGVVDIMCDPMPAFQTGVLGCLSSERLGFTCYRVRIPIVIKAILLSV